MIELNENKFQNDTSYQLTTENIDLDLNGKNENQDNAEVLSLINDESTYSENEIPRIKAELDCLNYANESINNLELELEDSKREFLNTKYEYDEILYQKEKSLGKYVSKAYPYYELRKQLNDSKHQFTRTKNQFETSQELYVAAKKMKEYCEDSLEKFESNQVDHTSEITNSDKETLVKMLNLAILKVGETETAKQISDSCQIEAQIEYEQKLKEMENLEKNLKSSIEKSRTYYEIKAKQNKELKFLYSKIEGLKSCLKEAKNTYQQALKNLEIISTEIHQSRIVSYVEKDSECSNMDIPPSIKTKSSREKINILVDESLESSLSSLKVSDTLNEKRENDTKGITGSKSFSSILQFSQKKNGISLISDEEIENLRLDNLLEQYEFELKKAYNQNVLV